MKSDEDIQNECDLLKAEEFEVLQSMFDDRELQFLRDHETSVLSSNLVFKKALDNVKIELHFTIPSSYPIKERPSVFIQGSNLQNERKINNDLKEWIDTLDLEIPIIADIIMWLNDHAEEFELINNRSSCPTPPAQETYSRFYIYSHHLYSSIKRSDIMKLSRNYDLKGFSTPGKPAVIIVEGKASSCQNFYNEIKSWNWQRLVLRSTETDLGEKDLKFQDFREVNAAGANNKHVNTGEIKKILESSGLGEMFDDLYNL
ncbi:unnamed protein product [Auanema sp. JU1783]|nr:unnamed protein product [Auanema sp. JU1783]